MNGRRTRRGYLGTRVLRRDLEAVAAMISELRVARQIVTGSVNSQHDQGGSNHETT